MTMINLLDRVETFINILPKRNCHPKIRKIILYILDNFIEGLYNFFNDFDDRLKEKQLIFKRIDIDEHKLTELIFKEYLKIYQREDRQPKYCLIGRDEWIKFNGEIRNNYSFSFNYNPKIYSDGQMIFNGLKCIYVPWMDGLVVLPELDEI